MPRAPAAPIPALASLPFARPLQLRKRYGGLPTKKGPLGKVGKAGGGKYFDSADWAKEKTLPKPEPQQQRTPSSEGMTSADQGPTLPPKPQ